VGRSGNTQGKKTGRKLKRRSMNGKNQGGPQHQKRKKEYVKEEMGIGL